MYGDITTDALFFQKFKIPSHRIHGYMTGWHKHSKKQSMDRTDMEQGGVSAEPAPENKLSVLKKQADDVTKIMKNNLEKKLEGQKMAENLLTISEEMEKAAQNLDKTTKKVENSYRWKNVKLIIIIVVIVLVIVLIIVLLATGVIPVNAPLPPVVTPTTKP